MPVKIPVTVLIMTKEEAKNLPRCLAALERFDEIVVIDSGSTDFTCDIARSMGARVEAYSWNGRYPKKRQWCLDTLILKHDRVFFVDADEEVTDALIDEIAALDWQCAGYFVRGAYVVDGRVLKFGQKNNKLCLFDRRLIAFPVVDDLDISGMGEIEGHYQPVLKAGVQAAVGQLRNALNHHALEDRARWSKRHAGYTQWFKGMEARALPSDPSFLRRCIKWIFSKMPQRGLLAFAHSYIFKGGFIDGKGGYALACSRFKCYEKDKSR